MHCVELSRVCPMMYSPTVVTIGKFDGVHRGHRALMDRVVARARELGATPVAITFDPHPSQVLAPQRKAPLLTTFSEKLELIARAGVEATVWIRFDKEFAAQTPEDFVRKDLCEKLGAVEVWVGPDFSLGRNRSGSLEVLRKLGRKHGFELKVLEVLAPDGAVVSSSLVREAVQRGDLKRARNLLGREFQLTVPHHVVWPKGSGEAYLPDESLCLPPPGVYAAQAMTGSFCTAALVTIGPSSVVTGGAPTVSVRAHSRPGAETEEAVCLIFMEQLSQTSDQAADYGADFGVLGPQLRGASLIS